MKSNNTIILLRHISFWRLKENATILFQKNKNLYLEGLKKIINNIKYDKIVVFSSNTIRTKITTEIINELLICNSKEITYIDDLETEGGKLRPSTVEFIDKIIDHSCEEVSVLIIIIGHYEMTNIYPKDKVTIDEEFFPQGENEGWLIENNHWFPIKQYGGFLNLSIKK